MERVARPWRWLGIAAVVAIGAVVTSVWLHFPDLARPETPQDATEPAVGETVAIRPAPEPVTSAERAKLEELRAMSETFRNTTFLIAIRDSGYLCSDLVSVYGGVGDSTTWTAACRELLAYTVRVSQTGTLLVEPTLQYHDPIGPSVQPAPQPR
jgi:hypothetical protein